MKRKLNLSTLTALVLSSMLGAGVFSLPQNISKIASPAALIIGWIITGIGIMLLTCSMLMLNRIRPDLDGGIFIYAKEGFGELIGFCSVWGYWLCAVIANVSYLVMVFSAFSFFTDTTTFHLFGDGNTKQSIIGASILLWFIHWLILRGVQSAASINLVATIIKLIPLILFIILAIFKFKLDLFKTDFIGNSLKVPIWEQVKNTMLITLWVFIGVEGAATLSSRARNKNDIVYSTLLAVLLAFIMYMMVTLLSLGIGSRSELINMRNPSMAGLMTKIIGSSLGELIVVISLIVSVCSAYLSWTIMSAEVLLLASKHKIFLPLFAFQNKNNVPLYSLWLTNISVQTSLLLIWITKLNYNILLLVASEMILVPYFFVGAYLSKISNNLKQYILGISSCIYILYLLYSSGTLYLLLSVLLYIPGIIIFICYRIINDNDTLISFHEILIIIILIIALIPAIWVLMN